MLRLRICVIGFICVSAMLLTRFGEVAAKARIIQSNWADSDPILDTNPASLFWQNSLPTYLDADAHGKPDPRYRTEVRTRWSAKNLYFLFVCPYEELNLKPNPNRSAETYELWNWDVAEVFIGADFTDIRRYKEFEISPQGEWIDLDIDLSKPHHEEGWKWNSGFTVAARIDPVARVWYGAMRIPFSALQTQAPAIGDKFRINLFRSQGPAPNRIEVVWQPTMSHTFHTPEKFGLLRLIAEEPK